MSAIAALFVVWQNRKQRIESYKPEFALVKTTVDLELDEDRWLPRKVDSNDERVLVPIVNIGLGAAKDVKVRWHLPVDELVSTVNRLAQESLTSAYYEVNDGFLSMKPGNWYVRLAIEEEVDYILPAATQGARTDHLQVPQAYVNLVFAHYRFAIKSTKDAGNIPEVLPVECRIEHVDIGGKRHSTSLALAMVPSMLSDDRSQFTIRTLT